MKVHIPESKQRIAEADFLGFERQLGVRLSEEVKDFFRRFGGSSPALNRFAVGDHNGCGVNEFIPFKSILEERAFLEEETRQRMIPIAWAECGNYVCIDFDESGAIYFWDHEENEPYTRLASDIWAFLENLEPFDINSVKLQPGQVKRAWIDPDLLREQAEEE